MRKPDEFGLGELLARTAAGDANARGQLLLSHRDRLLGVISLRIDPRLAARIDASDVVQDVLAEADCKLDVFLRDQPMPFYPWLRQIALERLIQLNRRHLWAKRRSVGREAAISFADRSAADLADRLFARGSSPSQQAIRKELRERVRTALEELDSIDQEVLVLHHLEQLSVLESAAVLHLSEGAVKMRHMRALTRLRKGLSDLAESSG